MASLTRLEAGQVFAGDFRVVRLLAEGGMGAVYEVMQTSSGHRRALKVLHPHIVEDARNRASFELEARIGAQIQSDHVVQVIAAGVDEPTRTPWLAMEFLEGQCLAERVKQGGPLPPAEARLVVEQLGEARGEAHGRGIVHRDLKPENLFIARSRMKAMPFVVKVLDFGISKLIAENKTSATATRAIGSPLWAAPEQTRTGAKLRPATDVWALGLVVFYMLTGEHYWLAPHAEGFNLPALLTEILLEPMEPASTRATRYGAAERLPPGFDAWFARCVVRDAEQRYGDANVAVGALLALWSQHVAQPSVQPTAPLTYVSAPPVVYVPTAPVMSQDAFGPRDVPVGGMGGSSVPFAVAGPVVRTQPQRGAPYGLIGAVVAGGVVLGFALFFAFRPKSDGQINSPVIEATSHNAATTNPPAATPTPAPVDPANLPPAIPPPENTPPENTPPENTLGQPNPSGHVPESPTPDENPGVDPTPVQQMVNTSRRTQPRRTGAPVARTAPAPTQNTPATTSQPSSSGSTPMDQARACFGQLNANECIINALRGRASSERELALLASTYQDAGRRADAIRTMRTYLQRYPSGSLAHRYQDLIMRSGE